MMYPPIFEAVASDTDATAHLGAAPTRLYPFGHAQTATEPYAVWQIVAGAPENNLSDSPDTDTYVLQVDVYASTVSSARATAQSIRDAIEMRARIIGWRGERFEQDSELCRVSFDIEWVVPR